MTGTRAMRDPLRPSGWPRPLAALAVAWLSAATGCGGATDSDGHDTPEPTGPEACAAAEVSCQGTCVDLTSSPVHCGECGHACAPSEACLAGSCGADPCTPGTTLCGEECVDTSRDPAHCGACGAACEPLPGTEVSCDGGVCQPGACSTGFADCDADPADGCEISLLADDEHCGGCGAVCGVGQICVRGQCSDPPPPQLSSGTGHTCYLDGAGALWCWGANTYGVLGDDSLEHNTPVRITALPPAVRVATGDRHTCAVLRDGTVRCWGRNDEGQVGSLEVGDQTREPCAVPGISQAVDVALGEDYSCALNVAGEVSCWGNNDFGQLGSEGTGRQGPTPVAPLHGVTQLAAEETYGCALLATGAVWCWGDELLYPVLLDESVRRRAPRALAGVDDARAVAVGGGHACVVHRGGTASCWGVNYSGEVGDGTTEPRAAPTPVAGLNDIAALDCGRDHTCAVLTDGSARCWGYGSWGALGTGQDDYKEALPLPVLGIETARTLSTGTGFGCVELESGGLRCWGFNYNGELGNGTNEASDAPVEVVGYP